MNSASSYCLVKVEMNAYDSTRQAALPRFASRPSLKIGTVRRLASARSTVAANGNGIGARFVNQCFIAGLCVSALCSLWVTRGWVGMFLSGQVLSPATYLFRELTRRTQNTLAMVRTSAVRFEGE